MFYILTAYSLSRDYLDKLERTLGLVPTYLTLADLRILKLPALLRYLFSLKGECLLLPFEDGNSKALLPILQSIASMTRVRKVEIVNPDCSRQALPRWRVFFSLLSFVVASLDSVRAYFVCNRELDRLQDCQRQSLPPTTERRVLYLKTNLWFGVKAGGSIGHIAGVVNGLLRAGYGLDFASAEPPVMVLPEANFVGVRPPSYFGIPFELNYYRFHLMFVRQVQAALVEKRYSFIYQRMSVANYSGVVLARTQKVPLVIEYNGSEAWIAKNWGRPLRYHDLAVKAEDAVLKHADLVVTISDVLRDELVGRGVEPKRIVSYPNCIDPEVFNPDASTAEKLADLRRRHRIDEQAVLITFIGTFGQWHGIEVLAKVIREFVDNEEAWLRDRKVHFMLVGDGLKMSEVRRILDCDSADSYCTLTGLVPQDMAPLHLAASDILMSPHVANADGSRFFGSPTKLFEYMGMGKAIVASDLDQIGEVLEGAWHMGRDGSPVPSNKLDNSCALLTTPGAVDEIKAALRYLVVDVGMRRLLGENARQLALQKYTWEQHCSAILNGLSSLKKIDD